MGGAGQPGERRPPGGPCRRAAPRRARRSCTSWVTSPCPSARPGASSLPKEPACDSGPPARRSADLGPRRHQAVVLAGRAPQPRPGHRLGRRRAAACSPSISANPGVTGGPSAVGGARAARRAQHRRRRSTTSPPTPVGEAGWYLRRDGFAWGGIGVAAIWYGGAVGRRAVPCAPRHDDAGPRPDRPRCTSAPSTPRCTRPAPSLRRGRATVDAGRAVGSDGAAARACGSAGRRRRRRGGAAPRRPRAGPGPAGRRTSEHAARVADLHLYLRQHHAERDQRGARAARPARRERRGDRGRSPHDARRHPGRGLARAPAGADGPELVDARRRATGSAGRGGRPPRRRVARRRRATALAHPRRGLEVDLVRGHRRASTATPRSPTTTPAELARRRRAESPRPLCRAVAPGGRLDASGRRGRRGRDAAEAA